MEKLTLEPKPKFNMWKGLLAGGVEERNVTLKMEGAEAPLTR